MYKSKVQLFAIYFLILLFSSSLSASDFRIWEPSDGLSIRQGHHIEFYGKTMGTDTEGNICFVWSDARTGDRELYAQLINSDGEPLWEENGKLIISEPLRQEDPHVIPDGNGNWIVTWVDYRNEHIYNFIGDIYMQKIDSNGNPMWSPASGIKICDATERQSWQKSFSDYNGGAVVIWVDDREDHTDIYAQHVDQNGNVIWEENGKRIAGGSGNQGSTPYPYFSACTDDEGGIIFGWLDGRDPDNVNLYVNKVSIYGELVWADSSGLPLSIAEGRPDGIHIAKNGNGGAFVTWVETQTDDKDIFGQYINSDGTFMWQDNGERLCSPSGVQYNLQMIHSPPNSAILAWQDGRISFGDKYLYSQKISDNNGALQLHWGPADSMISGNIVCDTPDNYQMAYIADDMNGGAYVSWIYNSNSRQGYDINGQHLNAVGNHEWNGLDGIVICNHSLNQYVPIIRTFNNNRACFAWEDYRLYNPAIHYQVMDINGNQILAENGEEISYGITGMAEFPTIIPSTGNSFIVTWVDSRTVEYGNQPYIQRIDKQTGNVYEDLDGVSLTPGLPFNESDTIRVYAKNYYSASDGNGGLFSVWDQYTQDIDPHTIIQKMDASGNILWGDRATIASQNEGEVQVTQSNPKVIDSGDGGAIVVYKQSDGLYAQRMDANGEWMWPSEDGLGYRINTEDQTCNVQALEKFNDGSILVVYKTFGPTITYAQRILMSGENAWTEPVIISSNDIRPDFYRPHSDYTYSATTLKIGDEILIVWKDFRREESNLDIYGQIISIDGTTSFAENGIGLAVEDRSQREISLELSGNYFWMAWQDSTEWTQNDVYIQKYSFDCQPQLTPATGIRLGSDAQCHYSPKIVSDGNNGIYVTWREWTENLDYDIKYTHLDSDGNLASVNYTMEGLPLTTAFYHQNDVSIISDGENGFIAVWADQRSSGTVETSDIYMQRVNDWIVSVNGTPDIQPEGWALENAYPNPFNPSTRIAFNVGITSNVKLTVYDILGREVVKLVDSKQEAGNHVVNWNGKNAMGQMVSSGTYFYRLEADDVMITRKMVLIK